MPPTAVDLTLGLVGASSCSRAATKLAFETGLQIADSGATLVCGGGQGVMAAGCAGAKSVGGTTVGVLPGTDCTTSPPNGDVDVEIYTGMGQARNQILVLSSAALIAVGGEWGTLSEIALASRYGVPVVLLGSWRLLRPNGREVRLPTATTPRDAVSKAIRLAQSRRKRLARAALETRV